ncbi:MAG: hypothetical protein MK078_08290 [Crocinitomicaceae bacterium]|nr:hypothetical protein [Crocinitomicaceae bacterium]
MIRLKIIILSVSFLMISCVKDVPGISDMSDNIFDPDYDGDKWYEVSDVYQYVNSVGLPRIRINLEIPSEFLPKLVPNSFSVGIRFEGDDWINTGATVVSDGDFEIALDTSPNIDGSYCFEVGVISDIDEGIINIFPDCASL